MPTHGSYSFSPYSPQDRALEVMTVHTTLPSSHPGLDPAWCGMGDINKPAVGLRSVARSLARVQLHVVTKRCLHSSRQMGARGNQLTWLSSGSKGAEVPRVAVVNSRSSDLVVSILPGRP